MAARSDRCRYCDVAIVEFNHGTGWEWLHIATSDTGAPGQPYRICKTYTVATPPETVGEWARRIMAPPLRDKPPST